MAKGKRIQKALLESSDVFILDAGHEVIIGRGGGRRGKGKGEGRGRSGAKTYELCLGVCMGRIKGECGREEACIEVCTRLRGAAEQEPRHSRLPCLGGRRE